MTPNDRPSARDADDDGWPLASKRSAGEPDWLYALVIVLLAGLTALRLMTLFASRLELYPDEAQYWVWSRHPDLGYFSKPPMIAWLIGATTAIGGQTEPWVRLSAPILHSLTAFFLALIGRRLYGPLVGAIAATLYILAPGVDLSSAIIATDAPLMVCLSVTLLAYAIWWTADAPSHRRAAAAVFGLSLGLACLAKYAALYFAFSALLHPLISSRARRRWSVFDIGLAAACFLAAISPNLYWNAAHHFQTVAHTAADADLGEDAQPHRWFDPRGGIGFVLGQLGTFGPIPFASLLIGLTLAWRRKTATPTDQMLLTFAAPPLVFVLIEAVVSRANANWAGAAYGPCALLSAAVFVHWRAWRTLTVAIVMQAVAAMVFMAFLVSPTFGGTLFGNSLKRARGWEATTELIAKSAVQAGQPLTAIMVDNRFLFNALSYYGRDADGHPAAGLRTPLRIWIRRAKAHNQAEIDAPLTRAESARVLVASDTSRYQSEIRGDFVTSEPAPPARMIALDPKHVRAIILFIAKDYRRRPRSLDHSRKAAAAPQSPR